MKIVPPVKGRIGSAALLGVATVVFAFGVLPWLATLPLVQARVEFNNQRKIDGGATFYTDQVFLMDLVREREKNTRE